ncbi:hypothetical protein BJ170DRAFT_689057 [Xylariales sp. AK1849]|nr:hypothetical protein BJ170DRAFT_689057 [Xylariales sp. AK1849]
MSQDRSAHNNNGPSSNGASSEAEMAHAFRELARGEQQAAAMEANLAKLENKLDALLAQFEGAAGVSEPPREEGNDQQDKGKQGEDKV